MSFKVLGFGNTELQQCIFAGDVQVLAYLKPNNHFIERRTFLTTDTVARQSPINPISVSPNRTDLNTSRS